MKRLRWLLLAACLALLVVMAATNPPPEAHEQAFLAAHPLVQSALDQGARFYSPEGPRYRSFGIASVTILGDRPYTLGALGRIWVQ